MLELMEILVTGLHGFIGQVLKETFEKNGHHVFTASREALLTGNEELKDAARRADIVVNLAGESIAGRWTDEKMIEIVESRRCITRNLVRCIQGSEKSRYCGSMLLLSVFTNPIPFVTNILPIWDIIFWPE